MDTFHSCCRSVYFYPRPPRGGRPETPSLSQAWMKISIHALREEGDHHNFAYLSRGFLFLSTPSARRATGMPDNYKGPAQFLSTPSARRATGLLTEDDIAEVISIHALREEGDRDLDVHDFVVGRFLSTPSARRATSFWPQYSRYSQFLSTPSARRATDCPRLDNTRHKFLSTPSARRATCRSLRPTPNHHNFYPRPPRGGRPADFWLGQ